MIEGGGSSQVTPVGGAAAIVPTDVHHLVKRPTGQLIVPSSPVAALRALMPKATIQFDPGYDNAVAAARAAHADVAIVFATKWESEGYDSGGLALPQGQDELIAAIAKANRNTIVVLETGNPVTMPWLGDVKAVVEAWFPGQKGGDAIADVLSGAVNPSGRLPITFPASLDQNPRPQLPGLGMAEDATVDVDYSEGADVGYRWFTAKKLKPLFAFGHGLSYTTFEHKDLKIDARDAVKATFKVKNTGEREGADVAQLYLVKAEGREVKRLAGFQRVMLKPGKSEQVVLQVDPRLIASWDKDGWLIAAGEYGFALGTSADELGEVATVTLARRRIKP